MHFLLKLRVSTHSRPKAAGPLWPQGKHGEYCFNTQPPEGGWVSDTSQVYTTDGFNTQPPEGGWMSLKGLTLLPSCFNTQPPEGGWSFGTAS